MRALPPSTRGFLSLAALASAVFAGTFVACTTPYDNASGNADAGDPSSPAEGDSARPPVDRDSGTRPEVHDAPAGDAAALPDAPPDAMPETRSCARASSVKVAPASLIDDLVRDLAAATDKGARVDAFLTAVEAAGGTPLEDRDRGDRVVFIQRGSPGDGAEWRVAGTFNGWDAKGVALAAVPGTDLYRAEVTVPAGTSGQYKLILARSGGSLTWLEDPRAHHGVWDGIDHGGLGELNAVIHPRAQSPAKGRLEVYRAVRPSAALGLEGARDVFVYVPAAYDTASCPTFPLLVAHDGNEALTRVSQASVADDVFAATPSASALIAYVALGDQRARLAEYAWVPDRGVGVSSPKGPAYADFLTKELLPLLTKQYRVCPRAIDHGVTGASMGGLISMEIALHDPKTWGYVGAQSSSFFWGNEAALEEVRGLTAPLDIRVYLDSGCPGDNCAETDHMHASMKDRGWDVTRVSEPGAKHEWRAWARRLPKLLELFRKGRGPAAGPGCTP